MTTHAFACGEPLCKRAFEAEVDARRPWPVKCPSCGRSLYPETVLQSSALDSLDPHRGPLMRVEAGRLVPVSDEELAGKPAPTRSILDDISDATDLAAAAPARPRGPAVPIAVVVLVAILALITAVWALGGR